MVKAVRRGIAPPPLSITIPLPTSGRKTDGPKAREEVPEHEPEPDLENVESLQKSVKFLAPDSDEDDMSDQSSICHSPSWEGYGQKKKDKKKEAERKRKAKEQAEREAKAAKKRASSRLSKAVPAVVRQMPTVMERSNSAPLLDSHTFRVTNKVHRLPTLDDEYEYIRPASHQNSLQRSTSPDLTGMLVSAGTRFIGGLKLQQEREAVLQNTVQPQSHSINGFDPCLRMHKSCSTGPAVDISPPVSGASSVRNDSRSSRETCPPSASRTPMLRHTSALQLQPVIKSSRGRESKNHQVTSSWSSNNHSQESLQPDCLLSNERGRSDGYVQQQRDQSTERALAGLVDERLAPSNASSSTRSSSQHTRRSSLSRDVKAAALKLTGHRGTSAKRSHQSQPNSPGPADYFNFSDQPHSPSTAQPLSPRGGVPPSARGKASGTESTLSKATQGSTSSSASSVRNGVAKTRSLKDVARAALHMAPSQTQIPTFKPTVKLPPYYLLRQKFSSSSAVPTLSAPNLTTQAPQLSKPDHRHSRTGPPVAPNQPGSRVSEGSSSSSNYDEASPLPSPVTTPDTSRPQSAKGLPEEASTIASDQLDECGVQDDARTLRQSSEAVGSGSSSDVTPRLPRYDEEGNEMAPEDQWSRTAMPMDIADVDFDDARSTMSDYCDAREEPTKTEPSPRRLQNGTRARKNGQQCDDSQDFFGRASLPRSQSDPDLASKASTGPKSSQPPKQEPAIPHRSRFREQEEVVERPKTASAGQLLGIEYGKVQEGSKEEPRESGKKKLRKQKPVPETKAEKAANEDAEVIERDDPKLRAIQASANTSLMSARLMSPIGGFMPSYGFASNPLFVDFSELRKAATTSDQGQTTVPVQITATQITFQTQAPAPKPIQEAVQVPAKAVSLALAQHQLSDPPKAAARTLTTPATTAESKPAPLSRSTTMPVSILKPSPPQPASILDSNQGSVRPPVLSAIPKHLQHQTSARSQTIAPPDLRMAPVAKMFVECCSCKFYHDMPSKLYECMAKPDAVVEDKLRGISGAITTMVKCPWCQHNMSTSCCAGYASVVYHKERLH